MVAHVGQPQHLQPWIRVRQTPITEDQQSGSREFQVELCMCARPGAFSFAAILRGSTKTSQAYQTSRPPAMLIFACLPGRPAFQSRPKLANVGQLWQMAGHVFDRCGPKHSTC